MIGFSSTWSRRLRTGLTPSVLGAVFLLDALGSAQAYAPTGSALSAAMRLELAAAKERARAEAPPSSPVSVAPPLVARARAERQARRAAAMERELGMARFANDRSVPIVLMRMLARANEATPGNTVLASSSTEVAPPTRLAQSNVVGGRPGAPIAAPVPPAVTKARGVLDRALASTDLDLKGEALSALGASRQSDARATLEKELTGEEGKLRFAAARGLGFLKDPASIPAVTDAFRKEKGWAVRKELATAAGALGIKALIPDLQAATNDGNTELAQAAAFALEDLGDPSAKAALTRLGNPKRRNADNAGVTRWSRRVLGNEKPGDKLLATRTLAELGDTPDAGLFQTQLSSDEPKLQLWSAAGLLRFSR